MCNAIYVRLRPAARVRDSVLALVALFSGSVVHVADAHARAPASFHEPAAAPPSAQATSTSLDLHAVLTFAESHSPALKAARAGLVRAQTSRVAAAQRTIADPQFQVLVGPRFLASGVATDFQVGVAQDIDVSGQKKALREVAGARSEQYDREFESASWSVHCDIHDAFHRALLARERLAAHERIQRFQERLFEIATRRLAAGDISPLAVRIVAGDRAASKVALLAAQEVLATTSSELKQIIGWQGDELLLPDGSLDEARDTPPIDELRARARVSHPPALVANEALSATHAKEKLAQKGKWSGFGFLAQVQREGALAGQSNTIAFGGLRFNLPLFVGNRVEQQRARVQTKQAEAELAQITDTLAQEIERAATRVNHAAARMRVYSQEILPSFEENLRLLERSYELGEIDILQVSLARERFLRSQDDALATYGDYYKSIADLERLLGHELWPDDKHEPASPHPSASLSHPQDRIP